MNRKAIFHYLNKAGLWDAEYDAISQRSVMTCCPFAPWTHEHGTDRHPSFGIWVNDHGVSNYRCFSCKEYGEFWMLPMKIGGLTGNKEMTKVGWEILEEDNGDVGTRLKRAVESYDDWTGGDPIEIDMSALDFWSAELEKNLPKNAIDYLKNRQLDPILLSENFDLKWDEIEKRICWRVYDFENFIGLVGRDITGMSEKPYKNYWSSRFTRTLGMRKNFNHDCLRVILVEGPFDLFRTFCNLVSLDLLGVYEVVCTFTANLSKQQCDMLEEIGKTVVCFYDIDIAGNSEWKEVQKKLKGKIPRITRMRPTEGTDAGDTSERNLKQKLGELK